ncbi:MAG: Cof-type HAD-IIB family hydrolase [Defluviitaleaceae bacterium]|nr:Cof-type HAD-IIB family hydrolase [Defluviitaleaceae bacterium]
MSGINYQLLCTDIDGTLLDNHGEISDANVAAVQAAVRAGKRVVLASGRTWHSMKMYEERLGIHLPGQFGVGFNGGAVYEIMDDGDVRLLHTDLMPAAIAQEIFAAMASVVAQFNGMYMLAYNNEGYLIAEEALKESKLFDEMIKLGARVTPTYAELPGDMYKILIFGEHEDLLQAADFANTQFTGRCQCMFSARQLLELIPTGVDKGRGVSLLAAHLNIPMSQVICMGDEGNDLAMLHAAGLGVAVANAVPDAIAAADVHLDVSNNDSALAAVIYRYLM